MECPRRGYLRLGCQDHNHTIRTVCKTWGCPVCRDKVLALVTMRMEYGLQEGVNSWFITLTYRTAYDTIRNVGSVARDTARFWSKLAKELLEKPQWFKVPELTKKGQVHLHLLVNTQGDHEDSCKSKTERYLIWKKNGCKASPIECLQHRVSRIWEEVTGDSFVVDVSRVRHAGRTANYLVGYLKKGMRDHSDLEALGFKRRWARSRNWPSGHALRLRGTAEGGWQLSKVVVTRKIDRIWRWKLEEEAGNVSDCERIEQVGTNYALALNAERRNAAVVKDVRRRLDADIKEKLPTYVAGARR